MAIPAELLARLMRLRGGGMPGYGTLDRIKKDHTTTPKGEDISIPARYQHGGIAGMDGGMPDLTSANLRVTSYGPGSPNPTRADMKEFTGLHNIPLRQGSAALPKATAKAFGLKPGQPFMHQGQKYFYHDQPAKKVGNVLDVYHPQAMQDWGSPSWGAMSNAFGGQPTGGSFYTSVDPQGNFGYAPGTYTGVWGGPMDPGTAGGGAWTDVGFKYEAKGGVIRTPEEEDELIKSSQHQFNPRSVPIYNAVPLDERTILPTRQRFYEPMSEDVMPAKKGGVVDTHGWQRYDPRADEMRPYQDGGVTKQDDGGQATDAQDDPYWQAMHLIGTSGMQAAAPDVTYQRGGVVLSPRAWQQVVSALGQRYQGGGIVRIAPGPMFDPTQQSSTPTQQPPTQPSPIAGEPARKAQPKQPQKYQFGRERLGPEEYEYYATTGVPPSVPVQEPRPEVAAKKGGVIPKEFMQYLAAGGLVKEFTPDHHLMFSLGMKYALSPKQAAKRMKGDKISKPNNLPP